MAMDAHAMVRVARGCLKCSPSSAYTLVSDLLAIRAGLKPSLLVDHCATDVGTVRHCVQMLGLSKELSTIAMTTAAGKETPFVHEIFVANGNVLDLYLSDIAQGRVSVVVMDVGDPEAVGAEHERWLPRVVGADQVRRLVEEFHSAVVSRTILGRGASHLAVVSEMNPFYIGLMLGFPVIYWLAADTRHGMNRQQLSLFRVEVTHLALRRGPQTRAAQPPPPTVLASFTVPAVAARVPSVVLAVATWQENLLRKLKATDGVVWTIHKPSSVCLDQVAL